MNGPTIILFRFIDISTRLYVEPCTSVGYQSYETQDSDWLFTCEGVITNVRPFFWEALAEWQCMITHWGLTNLRGDLLNYGSFAAITQIKEGSKIGFDKGAIRIHLVTPWMT
jgi:hypothetical protein